jgi:hypothetical protein
VAIYCRVEYVDDQFVGIVTPLADLPLRCIRANLGKTWDRAPRARAKRKASVVRYPGVVRGTGGPGDPIVRPAKRAGEANHGSTAVEMWLRLEAREKRTANKEQGK